LISLSGKACANPVRFGVKGASHVPDAMPETMQNPTQPQVPMFNVPGFVLGLGALLLGIHALLWWLGPDWQIWSLYAMSFIPARLTEASDLAAPQGAWAWTFLTHALLHGDWFHVGSNVIWMTIFATPVTRRLGPLRTALLLAASAIMGAAAMLPLHWGAMLIVVGASGAVCGAMAAAMPLMYAEGFSRGANSLAAIQPLSPGALLQNRQALAFTALFLGLTFLTGASQATTGTAFLEEQVIAWEAHLGGFVTGLVAFYILDRGISQNQMNVLAS
jgi:membrane associated rhomboid family serine protease